MLHWEASYQEASCCNQLGGLVHSIVLGDVVTGASAMRTADLKCRL